MQTKPITNWTKRNPGENEMTFKERADENLP